MAGRFSAVVVAMALTGLFAGHHTGSTAQFAQTGGTSSGSSGNGSSGNSATSNGTSSSNTGTGGGGGTGGTGGTGTGTTRAPNDGSSGFSSNDGSSSSNSGGGDTGGGTGTTLPSGGGTGTTAPASGAIPQPSTSTSVPPSQVSEGRPTSCPATAGDDIRCFDIGDNEGVRAVRIPDGIGGFVLVPIVPAPVVNVDSGTSTSAASNVDARVQVNVRTGDVIRVERRADERRQWAYGTIALLLLAVIAAASVASYLRIRKLGR